MIAVAVGNLGAPGVDAPGSSTAQRPAELMSTPGRASAVSVQDVLVGLGPQGLLPVLEQRERPVLGHVAVLVLVPAVHVRPAPRHDPVLGVDPLVELVVHVLAHLERPAAAAEEMLEAAEDVADAALGEVDD